MVDNITPQLQCQNIRFKKESQYVCEICLINVDNNRIYFVYSFLKFNVCENYLSNTQSQMMYDLTVNKAHDSKVGRENYSRYS